MKMPSKDQVGREIFPHSKFLYGFIYCFIEKHLCWRKGQVRCYERFLLYGFCSLDGFHQPDLFSNSVKRVIRKVPDSLPVTCEEPAKEIDKKFLGNARALRSFDDVSFSSKKKIRCAQLKPEFFHG
jgi:hypothetical protein